MDTDMEILWAAAALRNSIRASTSLKGECCSKSVRRNLSMLHVAFTVHGHLRPYPEASANSSQLGEAEELLPYCYQILGLLLELLFPHSARVGGDSSSSNMAPSQAGEAQRHFCR